jgi:hypothetical protein
MSSPTLAPGTLVFKGTRIPVDLVADGRRDSGGLSDVGKGNDCCRAVVPAGVSAARAPQPPPLAGEEAAEEEILPPEQSAHGHMRFLIDECLHESLAGLARFRSASA